MTVEIDSLTKYSNTVMKNDKSYRKMIIHVLVISRDLKMLLFLKKELNESVEKITRAVSLEASIAASEQYEPDIILLDDRAVPLQEYCRYFLDNPTSKKVYTVPMLSEISKDSIELASRLGFTDYISCLRLPFELSVKIESFKKKLHSQYENTKLLKEHNNNQFLIDSLQKQLSNSIEKLKCDVLTGVLNKEAMVQELKKKQDTKNNVIYINIVDFHKFNEIKGYYNADELLKDLSKVLIRKMQEFCSKSFGARLHADRFLLHVEHRDMDKILQFSKEICHNFYKIKKVQLSVIVAFYHKNTDILILIKELESDISKCKKSGQQILRKICKK